MIEWKYQTPVIMSSSLPRLFNAVISSETISVPVKAVKANLPQYDLSQVAPQGYTGLTL